MRTDHPSISWILAAKQILLWILVRTWTRLRVRLNSTLKKRGESLLYWTASPSPPKKKDKLYTKRQNMTIRFRDLLMSRNCSRSTANGTHTPSVSYGRQDKCNRSLSAIVHDSKPAHYSSIYNSRTNKCTQLYWHAFKYTQKL